MQKQQEIVNNALSPMIRWFSFRILKRFADAKINALRKLSQKIDEFHAIASKNLQELKLIIIKTDWFLEANLMLLSKHVSNFTKPCRKNFRSLCGILMI